MKKLIIIGAGISGLTAGVYAARSGIDTTIVERTGYPGGVTTSWKRKGYTFDGGAHWLIGSTPRNPIHDIWIETGALSENNPVSFKDPVYSYMDGGKETLKIIRDAKAMLRQFKQHSPRDRWRINLLGFHIWCFKNFHPPVLDIPGLKVRGRHPFRLMEFIKMAPAPLITPYLMSLSTGQYCNRFRDKQLRDLLASMVQNNQNALSLIYTLSMFCYGDSGFSKGGSLTIARNMAATFTSEGGKLIYGTKVDKIYVEDGRCKGVRIGETIMEADAVLITQDARKAIDQLFDQPLQDKWARAMRHNFETEQCMFLAYGVRADLSDYPAAMVFSLEKPFEAGGKSFRQIRVNNYSYEKSYAPEGCTVLTCLLSDQTYEFWKAAKDNGTYKEAKKDVLDRMAALLEEFIPEIKGRIEVTDHATPLTYERYCDTYHGSWMSLWRPFRLTHVAPLTYKKIPGVYFAGQRTGFSGGLPPTVTSGRKAAQIICRDFGLTFVSQ